MASVPVKNDAEHSIYIQQPEVDDVNYLLAMTPEQAQTQRFPIGTTVLHIKFKPFPEVEMATVQSIGVNILSQTRENVYTILSTQTNTHVLAKQEQLQFIAQTPVWYDEEAAVVMWSYQESVSAPALYAIQMVDGPLLKDIPIHGIKLRRNGENVQKRSREELLSNHTAQIKPSGTQELESASNNEHVKSEDIEGVSPRDIEFPITEKGTTAVVATAGTLHPRQPTHPQGQVTVEARNRVVIDLLDEDDNGNALDVVNEDMNEAHIKQSQIKPQLTPSASMKSAHGEQRDASRRVILPNWVDPEQLKAIFRARESSARSLLESNTRCLIWMSGNLVRPIDSEPFGLVIHIEGASQDVNMAITGVLQEASTSLPVEIDVSRFLHDVFLANIGDLGFERFDGSAIWMVEPPHFTRCTWMTTVILPHHCSRQVVGALIGHNGDALEQLKKETNCEIMLCQSNTPYLYITANTSEYVNRCVQKLRNLLQSIVTKSQRKRKKP